MSKPRYTTIPAGALTDEHLNMTDIRVLGILGTYNWHKGWCFPLQDTIAEALNRSRPVVNASLARLEARGYVESKKKKGGANRKLYRVVLDQKDDGNDMPDGMLEAERDVSPANTSKRKDVRPTDMSTQQTCPSDKQVSREMSAPPTIDVSPADIQRELEIPNEKREAASAAALAKKPEYLPEDWEPRDDEVKVAEGLNFTKQQFDDCLHDFRTYWLGEAGRKVKAARKLDWDSTFRNNLRTTAGRWKTTFQKPSPWTVPVVTIESDWPAALAAWGVDGAWKPSLGPTPDKPGYRGPLEPLRALIAGKDPKHPVIAAIAAKLDATQKEDLFA